MEHDKEYLGDGVYISHDGYQVWLSTQDGMRIALEPGLPEAVVSYWRKIQHKYRAPSDEASHASE